VVVVAAAAATIGTAMPNTAADKFASAYLFYFVFLSVTGAVKHTFRTFQ